MSCMATQDRRFMEESSDKTWSTREWNGKPLQYSCLENPMNSMKRQKDETERWTPQVGRCPVCYWRSVEKQLQKEWREEPKQKQYPVVDMTGDGSKVWCYKEQYFIGTWNVRSMNQGKLDVVKQEMARVNIDILGISELKSTGWVNLNQMTIMSTTAGRNPSEEME